MAIIFELYVFDALIMAGLSNAMPDFMQNKKSAKRSINTNKFTTRSVTTNKSTTRPVTTNKSVKQSSAARPRSSDESSVLDVNTLRHKANSDWSDFLDPGISCGGKKGNGLMKAQRKLTDVTLVCFSVSCVFSRIPTNTWFHTIIIRDGIVPLDCHQLLLKPLVCLVFHTLTFKM